VELRKLVEQFKQAQADELAAIEALEQYLRAGALTDEKLSALNATLIATGQQKEKIQNQLLRYDVKKLSEKVLPDDCEKLSG
jgi:phage-related minor tail protein